MVLSLFRSRRPERDAAVAAVTARQKVGLPIRLKVPLAVIGLSVMVGAMALTAAYLKMRRIVVEEAVLLLEDRAVDAGMAFPTGSGRSGLRPGRWPATRPSPRRCASSRRG